MGEVYSNKNLNQIKNDVRNEFKNIDSFWGRDDQEIYTSGLKIIETYKDQVLKSDRLINKERYITGKDGKPVIFKSGNEYQKAAEKYFNEAYNKIHNLHDNVKRWGRFTTETTNETIIADVAKKIDKAENDALRKIEEYCNPMQEGDNEAYRSSVEKDKKGNVKVNKNGEVITQKPMFTQSADGTITFTDRSNPLKIHQVLGGLFNDKNKVYKIDYSNCTNLKIKNKMQSMIGGVSCWIKYDKASKTYVLTDKTGKMLSNRALVWEGVTLKQDTIMESQTHDNEGPGMSDEEVTSLDNLRSTSEAFEFDANNYRYYEQYSANHKTSICSAYAYGVVSDILAKKGRCFTSTEVNAWQIADSSQIKGKFNVNEINSNNPQQQILNAPAGSFLTMRFKGTHARTSGVSHVMVSLGNGVYTDLFGPRIRKVDFKSVTKFSGKTFYHGGSSYTLTEDARLISPNMSSFPEGSEKDVSGENITPNDFVEQIYESTGANRNYIRSLIASQNNIPEARFGQKVDKLSIKIITKDIRDLELENKEGSSDVADNFLDSLKNCKTDIMTHYPNLTNNEYDEISKRAIGILYQESNAGRFIRDDGSISKGRLMLAGKEFVHWDVKMRSFGESDTSTLTGRDFSRGWTQIKFNQIFNNKDKEFLKTLGINGENDLTDVKKCGIATIVGLIGNYFRSILPMKADPFRKNDAEIIHTTFNDGESEDIARGKTVRQPDGTKRPRTEEEIQAKIAERSEKHRGIDQQKTILRKGLSTDNDFFNMLYYTRNKPSEIYYGTATPSENSYVTRATKFVDDHTDAGTSVA